MMKTDEHRKSKEYRESPFENLSAVNLVPWHTVRTHPDQSIAELY